MDDLPLLQQHILQTIKHSGEGTIGSLATRLGVTYESVRQQVTELERHGWIERSMPTAIRRGVGRPTRSYRLSSTGEELFPKAYDLLAVELIDLVGRELGEKALMQVLEAATEQRVAAWEERLRGKSLREKLELLRGLYDTADAYAEVEENDGELRLIERNCPFLSVARKRPALCSISVSTLRRLLGCEVVREERFQAGDGRCVFRVLTDRPLALDSPPFALESSSTPTT